MLTYLKVSGMFLNSLNYFPFSDSKFSIYHIVETSLDFLNSLSPVTKLAFSMIDVAAMILSAGSLLLSENKSAESHAISGVIPRKTYLLDYNISCINWVYPISILSLPLCISIAISHSDISQNIIPPALFAAEIAFPALSESISGFKAFQMIMWVSTTIIS
jgi:hypothetical protein